MWHNYKTSESDPRGVLGHGGENYNEKPFGGSVRHTRGPVHEKGPGALESINGQLIQSRIPHRPGRNGGATTGATFKRRRKLLIKLR
jgi:hypothetical protein